MDEGGFVSGVVNGFILSGSLLSILLKSIGEFLVTILCSSLGALEYLFSLCYRPPLS